MKKQKWHMLLAGMLLLIFLMMIWLCLQKWNQVQEKAGETETETEQILSVSSDEMEELTLKKGDTDLIFTKTEDGWQYGEDPDFPLDKDLLETKAGNLFSVTANRTLEEPADLSEYGLEEPAVQVTVKRTDGTKSTLLIGNKNDTTGDYYVKLTGEDTVYTVGSTLAESFNCSLYDLAVDEGFPEISSASISGLKIQKKEEMLQFTHSDTGWIVEDGRRSTDADSEKMNELTEAAGSLYYDSYINYNAKDLGEYGLDEPVMTVTIDYTTTETVEADSENPSDSSAVSEESESETSGESSEEAETETVEVTHQVVLEVGSKYTGETPDEETGEDAGQEESPQGEDGYYYVKTADSNAVHTVSADRLTAWLNITYEECVDSYVSDIPITGMKSLKVTCEGRTRTLTYEEETTTETDADGEETTSTSYLYYVDGEEADEMAFRQFCNAASGIQTQSKLEEEPEHAGDATLVLEYEKTDGSVLKAEYIPYENGFCLVKISDQQPGLVSRLDVESLIEKYRSLVKVNSTL